MKRQEGTTDDVEETVKMTSNYVTTLIQQERILLDTITSKQYKTEADRESLKHHVLNSIQTIYGLRQNIWKKCLFYKLAVVVRVDLRDVFKSSGSKLLHSLPIPKLHISVPDLFILYQSKPLELGSSTQYSTGRNLQLEENRGRHALRVFMSPHEAYEKGALLGWQLNEHYWTRHFRTCRESLIDILTIQFLKYFSQLEDCFELRHETLSFKLKTFLQRKFPIELPNFLRESQRIVVLKALGSLKHHVGTRTVTSSRLLVSGILKIDR